MLAIFANAQNVGINNPTPQYPLSFNGAVGDKISLWTDGTSTHYGLGVQNGLLQLFTKTINDDVVFGFGSSTAFTERMRVKGNGNVGIGNSVPYSPLSFTTAFGEKISLFGNTTNNCGFGVQSSLMQIHSDAAATDIAFGWGSSGSFNELMRIKGNGNVGIGNNPAYRLDVNGRMRIRSGGTNFTSAGIWLNNNSNVEAAFVGMQDDTHVGFNYNGSNFSLNTQTGAIRLNSIEGDAGDVMQSSGPNGVAQWASMYNVLPTYYINNNVGTGGTLVNAPGEYMIVNSTITFTLPASARLIICANYVLFTWFCPLGCSGVGKFYFKVDATSTEPQAVWTQGVSNQYTSATLSNYVIDVLAGTHTITFYTKPDQNGSSAYQAYVASASIMVLRQ
jgi:hypothetical protein